MKKSYSLYLFLGLQILSSFSHAGTQTGQITQLGTRSYNNLIWFYMNGTATGKPSCAQFSYWFIVSPDSEKAKKQYAQLMAAKASGQTITVTDMNQCTTWPDGEDVDAIVS